VNDFSKTVVLPENELAKRMKSPRDVGRDLPSSDFDKTLVLEDELALRREPHAPKARR
jgi:hypothetical protein